MQAIMLPVSILIAILYLYWIWRKAPYALVLGSLFFIEIVWQFISIVWIDCGAYITEQTRYSFFTGASIRYTVLMLPFAIMFPIFIQKGMKKEMTLVSFRLRHGEKRIWHSNKYALGFIGFLILYMYLNLVISGIPLLSSAVSKSRFYTHFSKLPFCNVIQNYFLPFFMLYLGIETGYRRKKRRKLFVPVTMAITIVLFQLLMDNKFYGLYDYVLYYILPILILNPRKIISPKRRLPMKWIGVGLLAIALILALSYSKYTKTMINPVQFLLDRLFSLQSHTFWGIDLLIQQGSIPIDILGFLDELGASILTDVSRLNSDYGIARVMYMISPSSYVNDMLSTGFLFAGSYLTVMISYLGYVVAFVFSFILSKICAWISVCLARYLKTANVFIIFLVFFVHRRYYEYFRVGNFAMVVNWKFLTIYAFFFFCIFANQRIRRSTKRE